MSSRDIAILILLLLVMAGAATGMGSWVENSYQGQFQLHEPESAKSDHGETPLTQTLEAPDTEKDTKNSSAFGYGAATGLLIISLLYCLLVAALLLRYKVTNTPRRPIATGIAVVAAIGFAMSYFVDGYFF